ncbi:uncharacterized protein LOC132740873 [Ruditapes philippinarum]|uniref:uncharacterized protein LOC132740873 n=1 Tax=Ruditapes philippinarum TaxID=129788 RepID=UPI00295BE28D|nr:uncharacterized protein LOC132740873 [Ruditapes philippinarum]
MATTLVVKRDDTRGLKLYYLIIEGGGLVLRCVLDRKFSTEARSIIDPDIKLELQKLKLRGILKESQLEKIYPSSGALSSSEDYDMTLLVALLRAIFCDRNYTGWFEGNEPAVNDHSDEAEIVRIRNLRNTIIHKAKTGLTETVFRKLWQDVTEVLVRFGSRDIPDLKSKLDKLESDTIDKELENAILNNLNQWIEMEKTLEGFVVQTIKEHSPKGKVMC